ncbi:MAG: hypothetical protein ACKV0T_29100 [Planctomycetales bacterium]
MKRVLCVWFPRWPLQRLFCVRPELKDQPVVLYGPARRGGWQALYAARGAIARGVVPGMPLAEAQALLGGEHRGLLEPHDPQADREFLESLARWCQRYSPLVGLEESPLPETLLLEITGCAPLFGGEQALAEQVVRDFQRGGFFVRVAVGDTLGAAWGAAHFGAVPGPTSSNAGMGGNSPVPQAPRRGSVGAESRALSAVEAIEEPSPAWSSPPPRLLPPGAGEEFLSSLSVAALRLPPDVVATLIELDLRTIGRLRALPRACLPSRLGKQVLQRIDQMLGEIPELIIPMTPLEPIAATWGFEVPTSDRMALEAVCRTLLEQVAEELISRQAGVQRLECRLTCVAGDPVCLTIGALRPRSAVDELLELVRLQLERTTLPAEVLQIDLEALVIGLVPVEQPELFAGSRPRGNPRRLAALVDRLGSRLGEQAVLRPQVAADAQPECAGTFEPIARLAIRKAPSGNADGRRSRSRDPSGGLPDGEAGFTPRPLFLKSQPQPIVTMSVVPDGPPLRFRWEQEDHVVRASWGPERIETGWWRGPQVRRDYYRVETTTGRRFWLFHERERETWFLHGIFE